MNRQRHHRRSNPQRVPVAAAVVLAIAWAAAPAKAQDPRAPEAVGSIPAQVIAAGQSASLDLTPYFSDPDGDALAYAVTISDDAVAAVSVSGNVLTIAGVGPGTAVATVFASDPGGLAASQRTQITVEAPNRAPEIVGMIPAQSLTMGQWVSLSVSSYFRDPEGGGLRFSATSSNEAVATVAVVGDIVTITNTGTGTAVVNAIARDPDGLSVQQSIMVAGGSAQVIPAPAQPGRAPPEPPVSGQARPGVPDMDEADTDEARQLDPFPPRMLTGFVGSTGYTLAKGRGQASAGYLGASPVAQLGDIDDAIPGIGQVSYGVTDDLTVTAGSGFFYLEGDSDAFPYLVPKYRAYEDERVSVAVEGYLGFWLAGETITYYAGSVAGSLAVDRRINLHVSGGAGGVSVTVLGESLNEYYGVVAAGGDYRVTSELTVAGEFRRVGVEEGSDGVSIATAALRFLRAGVGGEAGVAYYFEDAAEIRPVVSLAYRF